MNELPSPPATLPCRIGEGGVGPVNAFTFDIPSVDLIFFCTLPASVQEEVKLRLGQMACIAIAKKVNTACKQIAAGVKQFARGLSWQRIRALWYQFTGGIKQPDGSWKFPPGDWRILVNWSKVGASRSELPPTFIEFWRMLCEQHQRVTSSAWRQLVHEIWKPRAAFTIRGKRYQTIPGYDVWPEAEPETDLPAGWSEGNLYNYTPDRYELAAARIGIQKASSIGFKIRTSRVGLRLGEHVGFDDHEFDVKVNFPGQLQAWRPRCFGAVEDLTDAMSLMVIKPTFWDAEEEKKKVLNETDAMWTVVTYLTTRGYRLDTGSVFFVEHGLMAVRDWFEANITSVTNGKVKIARGGRFNTTAHGGQFAPTSGGNFRFKRLVEQYWRMINDALCSLPGQTGLNRDHAPEEMDRGDSYNTKLLKAAQAMDVERASQIIFHRLNWNEFVGIAHGRISGINEERDHKCQGWEKCGFLLKEWRSASGELDWHPQHLLAEQNAEVQTAVATNDLLYRVRRMSRAEAYAKHAGELTTVPAHCIPGLVGARHALRNGDPLTVRNGEFEFEDWRIDSDPIRFLALDKNGKPLSEGEKFTAFCNPMNPDALVICDASGAVVSVCPPVLLPAHNDEAGVKRAMGVKNSWTANKLAGQRLRHEPDAKAIEFMKRHNAAVMEGKPVGAEDRKRVRQDRALVKEHGAAAAEAILQSEDGGLKMDEPATDAGEDLLAALGGP